MEEKSTTESELEAKNCSDDEISSPASGTSHTPDSSKNVNIDLDMVSEKLRDFRNIKSGSTTIHAPSLITKEVLSTSNEISETSLPKRPGHYRVRSRTLGTLDLPNLHKTALQQKTGLLWQEIVDTEKSYLDRLIFVIQRYKVPLEDKCNDEKERILTKEEISILFGNIVEIKEFSKTLLGMLLAAPSVDPKIFISLAPFMKVFIPYVINFEQFATLYSKLKSRKKWVKFESECEKHKFSNSLNLPDILIMPIQRLPRYKLLLEELKKSIDKEDAQFENISRALEEVKRVTMTVNQRKKASESMMEVLRIQRCLEGFPDVLITPSRTFKKEGALEVFAKRNPLTKEGKLKGQMWLFLFNDILILSHKESKSQYQFEKSLVLSDCKGAISFSIEKPCSFCITYEENEIWFTASNTMDADDWRIAIEQTIDSVAHDQLQNTDYAFSPVMRVNLNREESTNSGSSSPWSIDSPIERRDSGSKDKGKASAIGSLKKKNKPRKPPSEVIMNHINNSYDNFPDSPASVVIADLSSSPMQNSSKSAPKQKLRTRAVSLTSYFKKKDLVQDASIDFENQIKEFLYQN